MKTSRRTFLKTVGGIGLFTIVPRRVLGGNGHIAPSDQLTKGIIGVGGIMQGADAVAKLDAGASLVQLYSGFIYRGPDLVGEVARTIAERKR